MREIKEEAKRHSEAKLRSYGADAKACGGSAKKYADGGKVHDDKAEDEKLLHKDLKPEAFKHRADGGPIAGGAGPKLGRGRKGGKGKTQVNIAIAPKSGPDAGPGLPPALGAGPAPSGPAPMPPKPMPPMAPPAGAPPMKKGGSVKKK